MIAVVLFLIAFAPSPYRPLPGDAAEARQSSRSKDARVIPETKNSAPCAVGEGIAKLPFARGRSFCTLDDYLAHLEQQGAIDLPWWRQVRPGVYEHVKRMPEATRDIATRDELMKRFGFSR